MRVLEYPIATHGDSAGINDIRDHFTFKSQITCGNPNFRLAYGQEFSHCLFSLPCEARLLKIVICACTFQRAQPLALLIQSLRTLRISADMSVSLLIIDNESAPKAYQTVLKETEGFTWPVHYVHEPVPGVPSARNRALEEVGKEGYLAFVDDDETVSPDWLLELVAVAKDTGATFVQGPVQHLSEDRAKNWWLRTQFFAQRRFADRAPRKESWTNNLLLDLDFVSRHGLRFDERLRFNGGEDTLFTQDIIRAGGTGAFAAKAWVSEIQSPERLTWSWAVDRQFRCGQTRALTQLLRRSLPWSISYCLVRSFAMTVVAFAWLASSVVLGRRGIANFVALLARASGVMTAMLVTLFARSQRVAEAAPMGMKADV